MKILLTPDERDRLQRAVAIDAFKAPGVYLGSMACYDLLHELLPTIAFGTSEAALNLAQTLLAHAEVSE